MAITRVVGFGEIFKDRHMLLANAFSFLPIKDKISHWFICNFPSLFTGERLGVWLALFPTVYLSAGTATALILIGGETMKLFFQTVCGPLCSSNPLTTVEWYLVFTSLCIVLSQLPNLNSIAGLSLIGAITAITYSTMVWVLSVSQPRPPSISYQPLSLPSFSASAFSVLNALGIVAFAFRGHNLALEIQVCSQKVEIGKRLCPVVFHS